MDRYLPWDRQPYTVERSCTCTPQNRSAECAGGWHAVDGSPSAELARQDAAAMNRLNPRASYRAIVRASGKVLA